VTEAAAATVLEERRRLQRKRVLLGALVFIVIGAAADLFGWPSMPRPAPA
jgi:hypothetical protein